MQRNPKIVRLENKDIVYKNWLKNLLWFWFIFNVIMFVIILIKNGYTSAPEWDVVYIKRDKIYADRAINKKGKPGKRPLITKGKNSVIFNDYVLLREKPDREPVKHKDFIPSGKITPVNVIEQTNGEVGGVKWYKIVYSGNWSGVSSNTGWVPEYGMVKSTERRTTIIRIRKSEIILRGYAIGMDFRGKWVSKTGAYLLANIDLSYLYVSSMGKTTSFQLKSMILRGRNLYELYTHDGSVFTLQFLSNRKLNIIKTHMSAKKADAGLKGIAGLYERKIPDISK